MAVDEFQQIAHARANMMLRGHRHLICLIGPRFFEACFPSDHPLLSIEERQRAWEEAVGMPVVVREGMEGFAVIDEWDA